MTSSESPYIFSSYQGSPEATFKSYLLPLDNSIGDKVHDAAQCPSGKSLNHDRKTQLWISFSYFPFLLFRPSIFSSLSANPFPHFKSDIPGCVLPCCRCFEVGINKTETRSERSFHFGFQLSQISSLKRVSPLISYFFKLKHHDYAPKNQTWITALLVAEFLWLRVIDQGLLGEP